MPVSDSWLNRLSGSCATGKFSSGCNPALNGKSVPSGLFRLPGTDGLSVGLLFWKNEP
ncbi:MAG: hypothetical protein BWX79_02930 [Alphaproteobacteria bacterium ADurb.Bin100]|nr:MAG: hypothetical protein BWX79_02930 [Alphaproteobacteria bacterium ADurb.Bin100]